jgi:hypothetical protein
MKNNDALKKHHFWIVLGLIPVLVLAAVLAVSAKVGGAIEDKNKAIDTAQKDIDGKQNVKSEALIKVLDDQRGELEVKRTDLWKENWERQIGVEARKGPDGKAVYAQNPAKNLFRWPVSPNLDRFNYTPDYANPAEKNQLKFGEKIPTQSGDEYNAFKIREVYLAEFSNARPGFPGTGMADKVAPTEFLGGWQSVLRHVAFPAAGPSGWGDRLPTSEQLWLALEDIWVQRAILGQIKAVNDQIGTFSRVALLDANSRPVDAPLHRSFASRVWQVDLKVVPDEKDRRPVLTGRLRNLTDRLQLLGNGSQMTLNVWFSADPNAAPFPFRVGGEFLKGQEEREIVRTEDHYLPAGVTPTEVYRVEQVFDTRTVPVRRINAVALGFRDNRHALVPLTMPIAEPFAKIAEAEKAAAAGTGAPGAETGTGSSGSGPPGVVGRPGGLGGVEAPGVGGPGGAGAAGAAGGTAASALDANRNRYVQVTPNVRRMPVALTVVVDQAYVQDVLLAYANSPLRFQTTQVHFQRFRDKLGGTGADGLPGGGSGENIQFSGRGTTGEGFGTGDGGLSRPGFGQGGGFGGIGGIGRGGPGGLAPPVGPGAPLPGGPGAYPGSSSGPGSYPGGPGGPGGLPFGPGGTLTSVSESQLTAGLVELTVYGVVSLYEKYTAPAAPTESAPAP